jgi:pimeloyl-ACP methyl ester carboxylesterase
MPSIFPSNGIRPQGDGPVVIALHCSGGTGRQWQHLTQALAGWLPVAAPDLIGCGGGPHWSGEGPFRLTDEARAIVDFIDARRGPVHLVGHSYGGGVALRVAVERPHRIASLSLYEPTAFHVLRSIGGEGRHALEGIQAVAGDVTGQVSAGAYRAAARRFVDFWNGAGCFDKLKPEAQDGLVRYIPKACLDFRALIEERAPLVAYRRLRAPLLLMCGERAPIPTELIARKLAAVMNPGALRMVAGASHMGPVTHAEVVARAIADHILATALPLDAAGPDPVQLDWAA